MKHLNPSDKLTLGGAKVTVNVALNVKGLCRILYIPHDVTLRNSAFCSWCAFVLS